MAGSGATSVSLFYKGCDIILTLRVLGGACGAAILTLGILCFFFCDEVRYYFTATYQVIFGILIILGEVGIDSLLSNFPFLRYFFGKGLFFIFVALFSIGDGEPYEWVIVSVLILTSIFYLVLGCGCCRTEDKYRGQGRQQAQQAQAAAKSGFAGSDDLNKNVAAASSSSSAAVTKQTQQLSASQQGMSVSPPIPPKNTGDVEDGGFAGANEL
jgi:hypothetical protein